jgi:hypothetical protein
LRGRRRLTYVHDAVFSLASDAGDTAPRPFCLMVMVVMRGDRFGRLDNSENCPLRSKPTFGGAGQSKPLEEFVLLQNCRGRQ